MRPIGRGRIQTREHCFFIAYKEDCVERRATSGNLSWAARILVSIERCMILLFFSNVATSPHGTGSFIDISVRLLG